MSAPHSTRGPYYVDTGQPHSSDYARRPVRCLDAHGGTTGNHPFCDPSERDVTRSGALSMIVPALMFDYQRQWMQATSPELRVKASGLSESLLNPAL